MNQGINGSVHHGLIDGAGSGHPGHVPWDGGANENGNHLGGGGTPRCWRRGVGGTYSDNPRTRETEKSLSSILKMLTEPESH